MYYTYLLLCADGSYYAGSTDNPRRRTAAHNAGRGAKYTRSRLPVELAYVCAWPDKSAALKEEYRLKHLIHAQKADLCAENPLENTSFAEKT